MILDDVNPIKLHFVHDAVDLYRPGVINRKSKSKSTHRGTSPKVRRRPRVGWRPVGPSAHNERLSQRGTWQ